MGELVPRKTLVNQALVACGGIVGGIVTLAIAGWGFIPGLVVGGIIGAIGLAVAASKENRMAGLVALGAGALVVLSKVPLLNFIAAPLLVIGGIGLIVLGGYSLFKFIRNMANRV